MWPSTRQSCMMKGHGCCQQANACCSRAVCVQSRWRSRIAIRSATTSCCTAFLKSSRRTIFGQDGTATTMSIARQGVGWAPTCSTRFGTSRAGRNQKKKMLSPRCRNCEPERWGAPRGTTEQLRQTQLRGTHSMTWLSPASQTWSGKGGVVEKYMVSQVTCRSSCHVRAICIVLRLRLQPRRCRSPWQASGGELGLSPGVRRNNTQAQRQKPQNLRV